MRTLTANFLAELAASRKRPRYFFEGYLNTTVLRYWTDVVDIVWDSETWYGSANLMQLGSYHETDSAEGDGLEVTLLGEPAALVSLGLQSVREGFSGKLWLGFLNAAGAIIADPHLEFVGKLVDTSLESEPSGCRFTLKYQPTTLALSIPCEWRYNDSSQRAHYPDDRGFEYMSELQKWNGYWGRPATK